VIEPAIEVLSNPDELARTAAQLFVERGRHALSRNEVFTVALSGGSTPKLLYELLANQFSEQIAWQQTHFFWTDERHVSPGSADSNYRMVDEAMLKHVSVPPTNVHRILAELPNTEDVANDYEVQLQTFFKLSIDALPQFDLILLGIGEDGHTASIFPCSEVEKESRRLVVAPWIPKLNSYRITLTLPVLNNARAIVFLVTGEAKAEILKEVLQGGPSQFPAQAIQPASGELIWLTDRAAASKLTL
jgi:6-phosphogluconolactonase